MAPRSTSFLNEFPYFYHFTVNGMSSALSVVIFNGTVCNVEFQILNYEMEVLYVSTVVLCLARV